MIKIGLSYVFLAVVYCCGNSLRDGWCQPSYAYPAVLGILAVCSAKKGCLVDYAGSGDSEIAILGGVDAANDIKAV